MYGTGVLYGQETCDEEYRVLGKMNEIVDGIAGQGLKD